MFMTSDDESEFFNGDIFFSRSFKIFYSLRFISFTNFVRVENMISHLTLKYLLRFIFYLF